MEFGYFNRDCMEGMKEIPDKFFDLAIVDPPYGINIGSEIGGGGQASRSEEKEILRSNRRRNAVRKQICVGGAGIVSPKDTRRSMTVAHRTPRISKNCNEFQKIKSFGAAIIFLTISTQRNVSSFGTNADAA